MHLSCTDTNTVSKWTETRFDMTHITWEYHWMRAKRFLNLWYNWCKPCNYLAPMLVAPPNGPKQDSTRPTSPRSSIECVQNDFLSLWFVRRQPCTHLASRLASSPNARNELPFEPLHLGVPSGASKMISDPMVHLVQTVHLSCTDTNTVSRWTKTRFHLTHVT